MKKNIIGLAALKAKNPATKLNGLPASYQLFDINTGGSCQSIKDGKLFELHVKFEELCNDALLKINEVAKRILTREYSLCYSLSGYFRFFKIKEMQNVAGDKKAIASLMNSFGILQQAERELLNPLQPIKATMHEWVGYIHQQENWYKCILFI